VKITKDIYYIATVKRPVRFINKNAEEVDILGEANIFFCKDEAEYVKSTFDEPEEFEIVEGQIIVDI
jgi:hypothetical protein